MNRLLQSAQFLLTPARMAKAVAKKAYVQPPRRGGTTKRTGRLTEGGYVLEGEKVRKGEIIWNSNRNYAGPWNCCPGWNN